MLCGANPRDAWPVRPRFNGLPMSDPARLLGLRLQGFKSFAERTVVEFGPGISAVVGPNGSGKSNLADALRWTLGEQGRSLRTRKSEDVIFAGSEKRAALGMADVTLVLDNADGLLPVDYSVLELGRRLYRSGESDYLLNRQRVRLKDLIDLLDAAHLADNAFLFIGQGMVDQALALRPEERRPLFEEVAGVRRHDRRRRRSEEQLAEATANLARVEDILAELRPQARRLASQAEQQVTRRSAGQELAAALLLAARARWHEAAARATDAAKGLAKARADSDRALADLQAAETTASSLAAELAARAAVERERRLAYEAIRAELTALQLREARLTSDREALDRDRARLELERDEATADLAERRRELASPAPQRSTELEQALGEAEGALADALAEEAAARDAGRAESEHDAAVRRAAAARVAELDGARRRAAEARRRADDQQELAAQLRITSSELDARLQAAAGGLHAARDLEATRASDRHGAQRLLSTAEAHSGEADQRLARIEARLASTRGALDAVRTVAAEEEARGIGRAARRRGGHRLDDGLEVDAGMRTAVEAALGDAARAYVVERDAVLALSAELQRLDLVVEERRRPTPEHAETLPPALPPLTDGACWRSSPGTGAGHWQWRSGVTRPERPCASWKRPCGYRTSAPRSPYRRTSQAAGSQ